jgi:hypothetical protein
MRILSEKNQELLKTGDGAKWYFVPSFRRKTLKPIARRAESRWHLWLVVLALAIGILAGAAAAGRIKFPVHW